MALRRRLLLLSAPLAGAYAYDNLEGGAKINRSVKASYAAFATFVEYKFIMGNTNDSLSQIHQRVAERWLWCVRENGGLYSKLAQAVSTMNHILPPEYLDTLSVIQDRAPTVGYPAVEKVFLEEFRKTPEQMFLSFEKEAIASASVAQVHRAVLKDGTKVAVKVQKPAIAKQIDADLFMYRILAYLLEKAFALPIMWSVPYTCAQLRQETDFRIEASNGELAAANIEPSLQNKVTIPKIYKDVSSKRVLTCEWIDGVKVTDAKAIKSLGLDTTEVMDVVTRFFSYQLFVSGHLHADPHPGNILVRVRPGSEKSRKKQLDVVVIDHGLYCHEPEKFRKSYALLWRSLVVGDTDTVRQVAQSWGIRDHELFASFQLFRPYKGASSSAVPVFTKQVTRSELMELQASVKERIVKMLADTSLVPPELSLVGRHLNLIRSLNKALGSPINRPRIMAVYANRGVQKDSHGWFTDTRYTLGLLIIEVVYQVTERWRSLKKRLTGSDTGGFEDMLEKQLSKNVEAQFGFKLPENYGTADIG